MGVEYSTFRPVTAAVCRQCRVLNLPGTTKSCISIFANFGRCNPPPLVVDPRN
jgi:hypothetical protein